MRCILRIALVGLIASPLLPDVATASDQPGIPPETVAD